MVFHGIGYHSGFPGLPDDPFGPGVWPQGRFAVSIDIGPMFHLLRLASLAILALLTGPPLMVAAQPPEPRLPNIVLFLADDLGWQDTSVCFDERESLFQKHYRTPHVARLARRGVRFANACAHCVCSPTRTSILTGWNPARHGVTNWTLRAGQDTSGTTERLAAPTDWRTAGIQPGTNTLPLRLKSAGYRTIHAGKAHWGAIDTPGSDPRALGFDVNIAGHAAGAPGSYQGRDDYDKPPQTGPRSVWAVPGLEKYHGTETHLTDALAAEAVAAIDDAVAAGNPFFLYLATYAVHTPIQPHPRFIDHYRDHRYPDTRIAIPATEACYASMVEGCDAALGTVMDRVRDLNIADQTLIIFTSDNGGLSAHTRDTTPWGTAANTHNRPLREGKGSAYEGGTRVPLIISWAAPDRGSQMQKRIPLGSGVRCRVPVISEDLMPTICQWAGVAPWPEGSDPVLDGRDLGPLMVGGESADDRPLLFHYPHVWGPRGAGYQPHSALRMGRWKVIYFYDRQSWELYDLETDIGETRNRVPDEPRRLAEMARRLVHELECRNARYPTNRQTGQPEPVRLPDSAGERPVRDP